MTNEQIQNAINAAQIEGVIILFLAVAFVAILSVVAVSFLLSIQFVLNPDFIDYHNIKISHVFIQQLIEDNGLNQKKVYNALFHAQKAQ